MPKEAAKLRQLAKEAQGRERAIARKGTANLERQIPDDMKALIDYIDARDSQMLALVFESLARIEEERL